MELIGTVAHSASSFAGAIPGWLKKVRGFWKAQASSRSLSVKESATLGDRRLVALVECEGQRFLVGASPSSVTLLAQLGRKTPDGGEK